MHKVRACGQIKICAWHKSFTIHLKAHDLESCHSLHFIPMYVDIDAHRVSKATAVTIEWLIN